MVISHVIISHPTLLIGWYIEQYGSRLDARRFSAMLLVGDVRKIHGARSERMQESAMSPCINQWWHWRGDGAPNSLCHHLETDSLYFRRFEVVRNKLPLREIIRRGWGVLCLDLLKDSIELIGIPICMTGFTSIWIGVIDHFKSISNILWDSILAMFSWAGTTGTSLPCLHCEVSIMPCPSVVVRTCGTLLRSYSYHSSGFAYNTNLVVDLRPNIAAVWHIDAMD